MTCEMIDHTLFTQSMLFGKLNEKELEPIVEKSAKKQLLRGDVLFRENDKPFSLFLVETGRIAIVNKSFIGKESVIALMAVSYTHLTLPTTPYV